MRRLALALAAVLALVALPPTRASGLTVLDDAALSGDGRLHEVTLDSPALGRATKVRVLLPAGYTADPSARYPVLFLLHGAGDDQTTWTANTDVEEATAGLPLIVVMPDAGKGSSAGWYTNWVDGPAWESYHIGELVPWVDAHYRTKGTRAARAVAGLSMGGFGSLSYAARHPDLFSVAGSFSGTVDSTAAGPVVPQGYELAHSRFGTPDDRVWGDYMANEVTWRDHNPPDLAGNLAHTRFVMRTGTGVPLPTDRPTDSPAEVAVHAENVSAHARFAAAGVEHEFFDRGYGTHAWNYWQDDLHAFLPTLMAALAHPAPEPAAFHYRSAERSFDVYGWSFTAERSVKEFLELRAVSRHGFVASGSGTVRVVTPPVYEPGARYTVGEAGDDGRLRFDVDLGPSHQHQQYTPEAYAAEAAAGGSYWTQRRVVIAPAH